MSDAHAKADVLSGEYEKHYRISNGNIVLDLGAHVGYFAEHACNAGAWVIAFEPHPVNFAALNERLRWHSAVAINKAAYNLTCEAILHECDTNSGAHSLFKHPQCSNVQHTVGCLDIGEFLKCLGIAPHFIKIDTEGSERHILESLFRGGIRTSMAVETHSSSLYDSCRVLAESHGMRWVPKTTQVGVCYCLP